MRDRTTEREREKKREKKKQLEQVWQSPAYTHVSDWHLTLLPGGTQGSELWVVGCYVSRSAVRQHFSAPYSLGFT